MPIAALNKSCHPERSVRAFAFPPRRLRRADAQSKDLLFAGVSLGCPGSRDVRDPGEEGPFTLGQPSDPVKRGLVRDPGGWKWSSFRHYAFREMAAVEIESEWTGRDRELKVTGGQPRVFLCPS